MAEIALLRFSLKLVWGLIANRAIAHLEGGSPTDEQLRQLLLGEFRKLHEQLDALRRKELVAATAFMENGYEILKDDPQEARKEFNKARDAAQMALGVVKDVQDKVLATKIMIASAIHEFVEKPEVAASLCMKYVSRINSLPPVQTSAGVEAGLKGGPKFRFGGSINRHDLLGRVSEINRCVWHFVVDQGSSGTYLESDCSYVAFEGRRINPMTNFILMRSFALLSKFQNGFSDPISMVTTRNKIFLAQSQVASQEMDAFIGNAIKVFDLETKTVSNLVGHAGSVLCLARVGDNVVSGSFDRRILIWDAKSLKCVQMLIGHEGSVTTLAVNDSLIFSGSTDCTIRAWDRETFQSCHTLEGHTMPVSALAVSNRHLFTCEVGGPIKYWDLKKWTCLHDIKSPGNLDAMHIIGGYLFIASDQKITVMNLGSLKEVATIKESGAISLVVGKTLCTASATTLTSLDTTSMKKTGSKVLKFEDVAYNIQCLYFDEMTGYLYISCSYQTAGGNKTNVLFRV